MTTPLTKQDMVDFFSKEVLPLFDRLLTDNERLEGKMDANHQDFLEFKSEQLAFNQEIKKDVHDFKDRQMSFNDQLIAKVETLEIEYLAIRHQIEEYDSFFDDPSIPEEKKRGAYKTPVIKVTALEHELKKVKQQLQLS